MVWPSPITTISFALTSPLPADLLTILFLFFTSSASPIFALLDGKTLKHIMVHDTVLFDHKDTITTSRAGSERSVAVIVITAVTGRHKADICGTASCTWLWRNRRTHRSVRLRENFRAKPGSVLIMNIQRPLTSGCIDALSILSLQPRNLRLI